MSQIKIGWAREDISTDKPVNIPGQFHMRISKGVLDPLTVTALTVDNGTDYIIFLSGDMVVICCGLLDEVRANVQKMNPTIDPMKILFNVTHAHTGANHRYDIGRGRFIGLDAVPHDGVEIASGDEYRHFLAEKAAKAVCSSFEGRKAGGIGYGYGYAVVAHSRRVVYMDDLSLRPGADNSSSLAVNGHAQMYGNTNDDMFSHYEAGADHFANFMFTFDAENHLTGAIVNVPCPSQNSEKEYYLSADYWNEVREELTKRYGNIFILPQCAAAGDLSPRILHYKEAQKRRYRLKYADMEVDARAQGKEELYNRHDIAERIAAAFDEVYAWAKKDIHTEMPIKHVVETLPLERRKITEEEYNGCVAELEKLRDIPWSTEGTPEEQLYANSILASRRSRFMNIIARYKEQEKSPTLPMEMHVISIGDIAFASNRFELFMDYQHRIQARSPFEQTFIVQLAGQPGDDGGSYLATERGVEGIGYSATKYCNLASPVGGQQIVDETVRILKEMHS